MHTRLCLPFLFTLTAFTPALVLSESARITNDTLVDVFPLSVGNQWTYRYFTVAVSWPEGNPGTISIDSGRVTYFVSGSATDTDSTSWIFQVERDLIRHETFSSIGEPDRDTSYSMRDTSSCDLIESHLAQHQLYRNANPYLIRNDVFPFTREYLDTTMICRYRQVGQGDSTTLESWIAPPPDGQFQSTFTFKKGLGLIRYIYNSGTADIFETNNHFLLSSIITTASQEIRFSTPSALFLYQNYPNPFNPYTTIKFEVPKASHVSLSVFDILGREVSVLVNDRRDAGVYGVKFDGSNLASGVYFYRLQAGTYVETRKLLLLR
jgi:Secretion system C-terminal sorting domain